ncbi:UDP-glucose 4-epimerase GalE, partial [Salmonella enterica subsp. enterica serovar Newport]|nr:UDP-glucose 4-epimerase GalE [Salmonella enterica subsp. enterica serovar Newport]
HGKDFEVLMAQRRPGDPAAIVANPARAKAELGWTPQHDDLDRIVGDALRWEERLSRRNS